MLTLRNAYRLMRDVKNWWFPLQYWLGNRNLEVRFRSGVKVRYLPEFFQISLFSEHEDPFWFLDPVEGRDVVDVDASIGDTAIHFARKGAKRVIALEPFPRLYWESFENLKLNSIGNVVVLNSGLSDAETTIQIPDDYIGDLSNQASNFGKGTKVTLTTLDSLVDKFCIDDAVLKL